MAAHLAAQILAAVEARITAIGLPVHFVPLRAVPADQLPGVIVTDIEDTPTELLGNGPYEELHEVRFSLRCFVYTTAEGFGQIAGEMRANVERQLIGTRDGVLIGPRSYRLTRDSAAFDVDADSLAKAVGGWVLGMSARYSIKTSAPDSPAN